MYSWIDYLYKANWFPTLPITELFVSALGLLVILLKTPVNPVSPEKSQMAVMRRELNEPCTSPAAPLYLATSLGLCSWPGDQHSTLHTEVWAGVTTAPADNIRARQLPASIPSSLLGPVPHTLQQPCAVSLAATRSSALWSRVVWTVYLFIFLQVYQDIQLHKSFAP